MEATYYYSGLPSTPVLVARTSRTPWKAPTGLEAYRILKELRVVGDHMLNALWEDKLAPRLHDLLGSMKVNWTSTDVVRIGIVGEPESSAPIILWIGVVPTSLSADDGIAVASKCQELLHQYDIVDIEVEIRESIVTRSTSPKLLVPTSRFDPTAEVREPLTTTLGLPIYAQLGGTGGFFITEGGDTKRLLLVTARHVLFSSNTTPNTLFRHKKSQPRQNVTLFSGAAFAAYLESIKAEIEDRADTIGSLGDFIRANARRAEKEEVAKAEQQEARHELDKLTRAKTVLNTFYDEVSSRWATPESCLLGHVILSPPLSTVAGCEGYMEDWGIIEVNPSKVDASNFDGNAIDLGTHIPRKKFMEMMYPDLRNRNSFKYPDDRLLKLKGTISDEEMRHPAAFDQEGSKCLMVIKRGKTTGLTIGRANNIFSFTRQSFGHGDPQISKEWAILPFDTESGAFSDKGDSGSVIVDGRGRIGGLLTGGAGDTLSSDIAYATPIDFLLRRMQENGLHKPNVNPVLT